MDKIAKLKLAHQVALETYRECPSDQFSWRHLCDYESALSRAGIVVQYGDHGDVTYAHDGEVSV